MNWAKLRQEMVDQHIVPRATLEPSIVAAFRTVPRHLFVPELIREQSYEDRALPIGHGQTISQPYMIALMLKALALRGSEKVLEVGTGSGYEAALLGRLSREVHSVEIDPLLAAQATRLLALENDTPVTVHVADGSEGWPSAAPYDAILVAAAAPAVPPPLRVQLKAGGRIVIPIQHGDHAELTRVEWKQGSWTEEKLGACAFVPLLGAYGRGERDF